MSKTRSIAVILLCTAFVAPAFAAPITLNKESARGMKDNKMTTIKASDLPTTIEAEKIGSYYQFEHDGSMFRLRISDVTVPKDYRPERECLAAEKYVIAENAKIGGTQMGSGEYECN